MSRWHTAAVVLSGAFFALPSSAGAHGSAWSDAGSQVGVQISVDGRPAALYPAPDGSGRLYVEAREGASYEVRLTNRTAARLGVVLVVDGLNAISGERSLVSSPANRMYVLGPWDETSVRGWRSSLSEIRRFTFVDERQSYSTRSGKANSRMGWIEVGVFHERERWVAEPWPRRPRLDDDRAREEAAKDRAEGRPAAPPASAPPASDAPGAAARAESKSRDSALAGEAYGGAPAQPSYPGTGWGRSAYDPVEIVEFTPEARASEIVTLRYEYASALRALGVLPAPWWSRDRLRERDRGEGFAKPPAW